MIDILSYFKEKKLDIKVLAFPDNELKKIRNKEKFIITDDRDNADYVYLVKDLIELKGRKYDGKRNLIRKFNKLYKYEFVELKKKMIYECVEFQKRWIKLKNCKNDPNFIKENNAALEILNNYSSLPLTGAVLKIFGKVEGYTIASQINKDMVGVIIEKANPEYKGIYQVINNLFCKEFLYKYRYVNRQQDTGDPGLRKAKLSYNPKRLIIKYQVSLR